LPGKKNFGKILESRRELVRLCLELRYRFFYEGVTDMARYARIKNSDQDAWYHIGAKTSGFKGEFPLAKPECREKMISLLVFYSRAYSCNLASFCIMGNHWHGLIEMLAYRKLSRQELEQRAAQIYPQWKKITAKWHNEDWERFNRRLFDISELMRNIQASFATWYNKRFKRSGRFWGDRYRSTVFEKFSSVLNCMIYIELNPLRVGLVSCPEAWRGSSIFFREAGLDRNLMPLNEMLGTKKEKSALKELRSLIYSRGSVTTKPGQAKIPEKILLAEAKRGFRVRGAYLKKISYFSSAGALGSKQFVKEMFANLATRLGHKPNCQLVPASSTGLYALRRERFKPPDS
jgi:REP-associated tyrosine transposase